MTFGLPCTCNRQFRIAFAELNYGFRVNPTIRTQLQQPKLEYTSLRFEDEDLSIVNFMIEPIPLLLLVLDDNDCTLKKEDKMKKSRIS